LANRVRIFFRKKLRVKNHFQFTRSSCFYR